MIEGILPDLIREDDITHHMQLGQFCNTDKLNDSAPYLLRWPRLRPSPTPSNNKYGILHNHLHIYIHKNIHKFIYANIAFKLLHGTLKVNQTLLSFGYTPWLVNGKRESLRKHFSHYFRPKRELESGKISKKTLKPKVKLFSLLFPSIFPTWYFPRHFLNNQKREITRGRIFYKTFPCNLPSNGQPIHAGFKVAYKLKSYTSKTWQILKKTELVKPNYAWRTMCRHLQA